MSIGHRSVLGDEERALSGAFFRALRVDGRTFVGALLVIDALGEPLEFSYNRVEARYRFLWRERDLHLAATRELLTSLLDLCPRDPSALFFLASETPPDLFVQQVDIEKPVARVARGEETLGAAEIEQHEELSGKPTVQLFWVRGRPSDATPAHRLAVVLGARGLLLEPFERVLAGLREAYDLTEETADAGS